MNGTGNKTIVCSVLFLDIVEYSKKSVAGQISLKNRFNNYLASAICSVPIADRIILDTGDGAALNFLGDIEDALRTALSLRESLLNETPDIDPLLLVRMGINFGPVRLVMDINGLPNVVGDGVNVAQRIMGFAEPNQIVLSRSYYDVVSHLSSRYAGMFHYAGSRTDKDVREHQIYAVGRPGDQTVQQTPDNNTAGLPSSNHAQVSEHRNPVSGSSPGQFEPPGTRRRAIYVVAISIFVVLVGVLIFKFNRHGKSATLPGTEPVRVVNQAPDPVKDVAADANANAMPPAVIGRPDIGPVTDGKKAND